MLRGAEVNTPVQNLPPSDRAGHKHVRCPHPVQPLVLQEQLRPHQCCDPVSSLGAICTQVEDAVRKDGVNSKLGRNTGTGTGTGIIDSAVTARDNANDVLYFDGAFKRIAGRILMPVAVVW